MGKITASRSSLPGFRNAVEKHFNIFMSSVETETLNLSKTIPLDSEWKRYIDNIFSLWALWRTERKKINEFIALANRHHPTINFRADCLQRREISQPRNP